MGCRKLTYYDSTERALEKNLFFEKGALEKRYAEEKNRIDYYPFGMVMPGRTFSSDQYRYGFNGKEKDDELKGSGNSYDFGARIYDSRLMRLLSLDPLAPSFPSESHYSFAGNNPVYFIDYEGKKKITYITTIENGTAKTIEVVNNDYVISKQETRTVAAMVQSGAGQSSYSMTTKDITVNIDYDVVEFVTVNVDATVTTTNEIATRPTGVIGDAADALEVAGGYVMNLLKSMDGYGATKQGSQAGGNPLIATDINLPANQSQYLPTAANPGKPIDVSLLMGGRGGAKLLGKAGKLVEVLKTGFALGQQIGEMENRIEDAFNKDIFCTTCNRTFNQTADGMAGKVIKGDDTTPKDTIDVNSERHP